MTTLAQLADRAQNALSDAGASVWSQAIIEEFVQDAIREYNNHFPRLRETTINAASDDHYYDLPADCLNVIQVEYPNGQDPPTYLTRNDSATDTFWLAATYYDIRHHADDADPDELIISDSPAGTEVIRVHYRGRHDPTIASGAATTVPDHHHGLLIQFAVWRALTERLANEISTPSTTSSILVTQMQEAAQNARATYDHMLAKFLDNTTSTRPILWPMDKWRFG